MKTLLQYLLKIAVGAGTLFVVGSLSTLVLYVVLSFLVDRGEHGIMMIYVMHFFGLYILGFLGGLIICSSVGGFVLNKIRGQTK